MCEVCGNLVVGNGYTNHCPRCLYSKHVDNFPGDRSSNCRGLMEPTGIRYKNSKYQIQFHCTKCGKVVFCKKADNDNFDKILLLIKKGNLLD